MSKTKRLEFSGKDEDFCCFAEQFEAKMYSLKLHKVLLDRVTTPEKTDPEDNAAKVTREKEEADLAELRYQVWCELIQCLDRKSVLFVRAHKGNGAAAWKRMQQHYKSTERPRIHKTIAKLTSLKMEHNETMSDYLTRAEDMQMDLEEVGEAMSKTMFTSVVLKGLSRDYENLVTVINYGDKKDFDTMKQDLLNFANSKPAPATSAFHSAGGKPNNLKCFNCKKIGHRQADCTEKKTSECFNCGKTGHMARDCRQGSKKQCNNCKRTNHDTSDCRAPGGAAHKTGQQTSKAHFSKPDEDEFLFSFMSRGDGGAEAATVTCELLIDSGCTGYMLKDKELFVDLDLGQRGTVGNANSSKSTIEGSGTAGFWVKDSRGKMR
jgi:hypothetical protein